MRKIEEECGVGGVYSTCEAVTPIIVTMLHHLNHRGQEGAGIVTYNEIGEIRSHRGSGWSKNIFTEAVVDRLSETSPIMAVGHDRYSTSGGPVAWQPYERNGIALAENANATNALSMLERLPPESRSDIGSDTDIKSRRLDMLIKECRGDLLEACRQLAKESEGANNWIIAGQGKLIAMRDPWGFHPLSIGENGENGSTDRTYVVASEPSAYISPLQMRYVRDVYPGEGVVIDQSGIHTFFMDERIDKFPSAHCIFELIYFASPDAYIFGKHVGTIRKQLGRALAQQDIEDGYDPGIIVPVQQSGIVHAVGYSQEYIKHYTKHRDVYGLSDDELAEKVSSLHIQFGLIRNPYSGRTFIDPSDKRLANSGKHRSDDHIIGGRRATIIDDSTVKGNAQETVQRLMHNAEEVNVRIASPPIRHPCYWAVDFADRSELIAAQAEGEDVEEFVRGKIGAKSLRYVPALKVLQIALGEGKFNELLDKQTHDIEQVAKKMKSFTDPAIGEIYSRSDYCGACFHGVQPTDVSGVYAKDI